MSNEQKTTNSIQTLPLDKVLADQTTDEAGQWHASRVISTIMPMVVRRDDPSAPHYQEALGYTFLLNSPKFPGLTQMDDGRLVLTVTGAPSTADATTGDESTREGFILFSKDEGLSWTQPKRIDIQRCTPINLGCKRLMLRGYPLETNDDTGIHSVCFSEDAGETFSKLEPVAHLPDGRPMHTDVCLTPLVEDGQVTYPFYTPLPKDDERRKQGISAQSLICRFDSKRRTWGEPSFLPWAWRTSEGSLVRAKDGALVAAFRTFQPGIPAPCDHWRGILTTRSIDNGKTWAQPELHFRYGHHHQALLRLPDGRIVMTYAARIGELEGRTYHGIEAVVSDDHGVSWDWRHRYILFRSFNQGTHSPQSIRLSDGRILTVFMDSIGYTWTDAPIRDRISNLFNLGRVSVVIWSL